MSVRSLAAGREQPVRRQRDEALQRGAPRDVLDVGIEAAILVDHQHGGMLARHRRRHQIAAHRARIAARRRIGHVARLDARIGERHGLGLGVARQQRLRHGEPAHRRGGGAHQEGAAVDRAVAVLVVEVEDPLVDLGLRPRPLACRLHCRHPRLPRWPRPV
jgi:hypothetical protein